MASNSLFINRDQGATPASQSSISDMSVITPSPRGAASQDAGTLAIIRSKNAGKAAERTRLLLSRQHLALAESMSSSEAKYVRAWP